MPIRKPLRRPHTKSRLGCQECKRRHIKCDEARPTCGSCSANSQACTYLPLPRRPGRASPITSGTGPNTSEVLSDTASVSTVPSPATVGLVSHLPTPSSAPDSGTATTATDASCSTYYGSLSTPVNMRHMELLVHFILETAPSLDEGGSLGREQGRLVLPTVLSTPYVVYQMLALSAMHMSRTRTEQAEHHRKEAIALQTQALSLFNESHTEVTAENCVPMLIFSSCLGLHALAEVATTVEVDASGFLDRFVTYLNLHRGVRAVVAQSWQFLKKSNISPLLAQAEQCLHDASSSSQRQSPFVADNLRALIDQADMGVESNQACQDAIVQLELVYQCEPLLGQLSPDGSAPGLIWTWPIILSSVFTDLLMKRRPEALIILCHYAVLLHRRRDMWIVGNAGRMLIEEITRCLGTYWREWLQWPNEVLEQSIRSA